MKTVALALGGGGARALAHVPVLEALDEMGVRPVALAGASFGAAIAAAYAAGLTGKDIRRIVIGLAQDQRALYRRAFDARTVNLAGWIVRPTGNPLALDPERLAQAFLPNSVPDTFEALAIPLAVVATDLGARREIVLTNGPLRSAVAASVAVPGLMHPVVRDGRVLADGAAVNPLPFDLLRGKADVVVAIDAANPASELTEAPDAMGALSITMALMGARIVAQKLADGAPDLVLSPNTGLFRLFDFARASAIMRVADPIKAEVKARLSALL